MDPSQVWRWKGLGFGERNRQRKAITRQLKTETPCFDAKSVWSNSEQFRGDGMVKVLGGSPGEQGRCAFFLSALSEEDQIIGTELPFCKVGSVSCRNGFEGRREEVRGELQGRNFKEGKAARGLC